MEVKTKNKGTTIFVLIVFLFFLAGSFTPLVLSLSRERLTEINTTEFTATIENVEIMKAKNGDYCTVYTEEYGDKLAVHNAESIIDINAFKNLRTGQPIFFRIENVWIDQIESMPFIPIAALKTVEKEIMTLDSRNKYDENILLEMTKIGTILGAVFLLIVIHCILLLKGINVFSRVKNRNNE